MHTTDELKIIQPQKLDIDELLGLLNKIKSKKNADKILGHISALEQEYTKLLIAARNVAKPNRNQQEIVKAMDILRELADVR